MGPLGYADDAVIIVPTACSFKPILRICDDYGKEYHVKFNSNKYLFSVVVFFCVFVFCSLFPITTVYIQKW